MTGVPAPGGSKRGRSELAILGGPPAFVEPLHVGRPNIGDRDRLMDRFGAVLDRRWLTNDGPLVQEFEHVVAGFVGVRHCVAMCNGTVALEIAIRAAGLGGDVLVSPFTFVATAHALQWQQITPVFCDVDPRTHNLDPARVEEMITPRTTGIIGVHLWGRQCAIEALTALAERRGLTLLFDAAHAFGCSHQGQMIGRFGKAEVLSFHATKFVNTFEGGAIVTDDDDFAEKARLMRNFGFADYDQVSYVGTNGKMNELAAAMGLTSLEACDDFYAANRRNYEAYRAGLAGIAGIDLIAYDNGERCNRHYVVVEVDESAGVSRDDLQRVLWAENVLARRYFFPGCHRMEPYRSLFPDAGVRLPETERLVRRVLTLPTGTAMDTDAVTVVTDLIRRAIADGPRLSRRLQAIGGAHADLSTPPFG
ncbi:MAG: aminotransferase class I/II-fold pyridoxal phosphate-dependent enzyme [Actinomycetota bacterium]|nr:aminotransferase class I/II-fold pyridoxal phosphate-dependent enzyme [Actinomycetota bacterium]